MNFKIFWILLIPALAAKGQIVEKLDTCVGEFAESLSWENESGSIALQLGGQIDLTGYISDQAGNPPGFFFPDASKKHGGSPRLELTADLFLGESITGFIKVRWDNGVHPGSSKYYGSHTEFRVDEFYLKTRLGDSGATLRAGQFTPQIGGFMARQSTWENSLISYPLLYENVTSVTDDRYPGSVSAFARRANVSDQKLIWIPIIWAPLYSRGVSVDGTWEDTTYSLNFMNSNTSSRGSAWNDNTWSDPTVSGRVGYRPSPNWDFGVSLASGSYLREPLEAGPTLPEGQERSDFKQTSAGIDIAYTARNWQVWAELWYATYQIPNFSEAPKVYSYFIEGRYDLTRRTWISLRWNQEFYNRIHDPLTGGELKWDNAIYRIDLGYGVRWSRHLQTKFQYSHQNQDADFQNAEHFGAIECVIKL